MNKKELKKLMTSPMHLESFINSTNKKKNSFINKFFLCFMEIFYL